MGTGRGFSCRFAKSPSRDSSLRLIQQMEHIGADLRRVCVPILFPVAVDFPTNTRTPESTLSAPLADRRMCPAQPIVGTKMDSRHHPPGRQPRAMNPVVADERLRHFHAHLGRSSRIRIQRHMSPRPRQTGRADKRPNLAASRGDERRQFFRTHAAPDHGS